MAATSSALQQRDLNAGKAQPPAGSDPAIEALVRKLGDSVRQNSGTVTPFSKQLADTAAKVLARPNHQRSFAKEGLLAQKALGEAAPDWAAFQVKCDQLRAAGTPKLDEFLVTLENISSNPSVLAALSARPPVAGPAQQQQQAPDHPRKVPAHHGAGAAVDSTSTANGAANGTAASANGRAALAQLTPASEAAQQPPQMSPAAQAAGAPAAQPISSAAHRATARQPPAAHATARAQPIQAGAQASVAGRQATPATVGGVPAASPMSDYSNPIYNQEQPSPIRPSTAYAPRSSTPPANPPSTAPQPHTAAVGDLFEDDSSSSSSSRATVAQAPPAAYPAVPPWNRRRPFLTGGALLASADARAAVPAQPRGGPAELPVGAKELEVVDDLLYTFMGVDGQYIHAQRSETSGHPTVAFDVEAGCLDTPCQELVTRLLPICEYVAVVQRFVESRSGYRAGLVAQAAAAAMRALLGDWHLMVTQLEHQLRLGNLTLQGLWFYCQQPLSALRLLAAVAGQAAQQALHGAALLDLLHDRCAQVAGDAAARRLMQRLLHAACAPYFRMLERWLCEGIVDDPYAEFMVQDQAVAKDALDENQESAYWHQRYTLRQRPAVPGSAAAGPLPHQDDVPAFLAGCAETILATGKHLNAVRECGQPVDRPLPADVHLEYDEGSAFVHRINSAFRSAAAALLALMRNRLCLAQRLRALKHYFLLDKGDTLLTLLDVTARELSRPAPDISIARLQSLLDTAVKSSTAADDPYAAALSCALDHRSQLGMLKDVLGKASNPRSGEAGWLASKPGRELFMLEYKVEWPLSVVVPCRSMMQYQLLFRHLFELKHVERELNGTWQVYQATRSLTSDPQGALRRAHGLCGQMMHFFHQYLLYVTFEVLEPRWLAMEAAMAAATTIDEVIAAHRRMLWRVMQGCLLDSRPQRLGVLVSLIKLKAAALQFAQESAKLASGEDCGDGDFFHVSIGRAARLARAAEAHGHIQEVVSSANFGTRVNDRAKEFGDSLRELIKGLEEIHVAGQADPSQSREEVDSLANLITRLDYNGFLKTSRLC